MKKYTKPNSKIFFKWKILSLNISSVYSGGKMEFMIFTKTFFMDETRTIGKKCLVNELVLFFQAIKFKYL